MLPGAQPLGLFCPDEQQWCTRWPKWSVPGGLNGVSQCSVLLKCPASSGCIPMRLGKDWEKAGERCGLLMQALALIHKKKHKVVHADAFQMSECQLPLQGMLVWYLSKVLRGRFTFDYVTCPAEDFFFFSSLS